jgi:hypothetical protein
MGFRRKKEAVTIEHQWKQFVSAHADLLQTAGVPTWVSDDHEYWQDIIYYGYPEQYQERGPSSLPHFSVSEVDPSELTPFVKLLELYFETGFAYLEPEFLKWRDRKA